MTTRAYVIDTDRPAIGGMDGRSGPVTMPNGSDLLATLARIAGLTEGGK